MAGTEIKLGPRELVTSPSLLSRLRRRDDQEAWDLFYQVYSPLILGFARQRGCTEVATHDVLQETMVCLLRVMPDFAYDPGRGRFRSFLLRIVDSRVKDAFRRGRRYLTEVDGPGHSGSGPAAVGADEPTGQAWDRLWDQNFLLQALERVKRKVNTRTFDSFKMSVLQELPVAEVGRRLGLKANAVYQHRNRVLSMLHREAARLRAEIGE